MVRRTRRRWIEESKRGGRVPDGSLSETYEYSGHGQAALGILGLLRRGKVLQRGHPWLRKAKRFLLVVSVLKSYPSFPLGPAYAPQSSTDRNDSLAITLP